MKNLRVSGPILPFSRRILKFLAFRPAVGQLNILRQSWPADVVLLTSVLTDMYSSRDFSEKGFSNNESKLEAQFSMAKLLNEIISSSFQLTLDKIIVLTMMIYCSEWGANGKNLMCELSEMKSLTPRNSSENGYECIRHLCKTNLCTALKHLQNNFMYGNCYGFVSSTPLKTTWISVSSFLIDAIYIRVCLKCSFSSIKMPCTDVYCAGLKFISIAS